MTARRVVALWAVLVVSLAFLGGCEREQNLKAEGAEKKAEPSSGLWPQTRPPIPDVPVPMGFGLDEGKSRSFAAAGARYVDHVYKGRANKFAVGRFYRDLMPRNRWILVTDRFVRGELLLDFDKETERCSVRITGGGVLRHTYINVQLFTSGRIPAPSGPKRATKK